MMLFLAIKADVRSVSPPLFRNRSPLEYPNTVKCPFLGRPKNQPKLIVRSKGPNAHSDETFFAPLSFKSPSGQLLSRVMQDNPHLLLSAVDGQLQRLRSYETDGSPEADLEEILYCLVVHKFMENDISLITSDQIQDAYQEERLKAVHSDEAADMIDGHLTFVATKFGGRMSERRLGKLYSTCVKFGYYLKRVDERFQLEKCINELPEDQFSDIEYGLRSYVRLLDPETLRGLAMVRTKVAALVVEKQERALFSAAAAAEEDGAAVEITPFGLRMLVLEAVAFGSFLWGAESYVDTHWCLDG